MELLDETIQEDFGIDINGNAVVDFDGFVQAIGALGNLDIELTQEEADYMNGGGWEDQGDYANLDGWNLTAGVNSLTPAQTLAYCRMRYVGNSDWERTDRQRRVIMTAYDKFKKSNPLRQAMVINKAMPSITTDMTNTSLLKAIFQVLLLRGSSIDNYRAPLEGYYEITNIDGMDVLLPDMAANSAYIQGIIYGTSTTDTSTGDGTDDSDTTYSEDTGDTTYDDGYTDDSGTYDNSYSDNSGADPGDGGYAEDPGTYDDGSYSNNSGDGSYNDGYTDGSYDDSYNGGSGDASYDDGYSDDTGSYDDGYSEDPGVSYDGGNEAGSGDGPAEPPYPDSPE